jgi:hypothetical protein
MPERWREILKSLRRGEGFPCHNSGEYEDGEDGEERYTKFLVCAGALEYQHKVGVQSQWVQVATRMGWIKEDEALPWDKRKNCGEDSADRNIAAKAHRTRRKLEAS